MADDELAQRSGVVRRRLLSLAAEHLGRLDADSVPDTLRKVASFAPVRRASAGAMPLSWALARDPVFRQGVAGHWRALGTDAGLTEAVERGEAPEDGDPVETFVAAYLLRPPGWERVVEQVEGRLAGVRAEQAAVDEREGLRAQVAQLQAALAAERDAAAGVRSDLQARTRDVAAFRKGERKLRAEVDRLRAQLREMQAQAREAADAAQLTAEQVAAERLQVQEQVVAAREAADQARRAAREGKVRESVRARLLLDTIVDATTSLRRELALPPVQVRPADLVEATDGDGEQGPSARALTEDDPQTLDLLLSLPQVHLVVDGYNVTKLGWPAMSLADQRKRLVERLGRLGRMTGAEVTCCFDGAEVAGRVPPMTTQAVRVRFSEPGQTADELVRRLVRAEPEGRPVVVVSSDREVISGVRSSGAWTVASAGLVARLRHG